MATDLVQRCSARLADAEDAVLHRLRDERSQRVELENSLAAARAEIAQYAASGGPPAIQSELEQGREAVAELSSMRTGLETAADWLVALQEEKERLEQGREALENRVLEAEGIARNAHATRERLESAFAQQHAAATARARAASAAAAAQQKALEDELRAARADACLLYTSPSPRDKRQSRMPSSA